MGKFVRVLRGIDEVTFSDIDAFFADNFYQGQALFLCFFRRFDAGMVKRAAVKIFQHISFPFIRHHRQQKSKVQELMLRQLQDNYTKRCLSATDISLWRPIRCY